MMMLNYGGENVGQGWPVLQTGDATTEKMPPEAPQPHPHAPLPHLITTAR
jgi:hypothetical protein